MTLTGTTMSTNKNKKAAVRGVVMLMLVGTIAQVRGAYRNLVAPTPDLEETGADGGRCSRKQGLSGICIYL